MPAHGKKPTGQHCWQGYEKRGVKQKGGHTVNNCIKKKK